MALEQLANTAQSTLSANLASGATSLSLSNAGPFPSSPNFRLLIDNELIMVRQMPSFGNLNRGIEGTAAAAHQAGALVTLVLTAGSLGAYTAQRGPLAGTSNLKLSAAAASQTVTISPGPYSANFEALLEDLNSPANPQKIVSSSTLSLIGVNVGVANGLDQGALASSTWYYIWLIAKDDGTLASLLSTSSSSPLLPSSYTYLALVGAVYADAGTHFPAFTQIGNRVWCVRQNVFNNQAASGANTYASVSLSTIVPSIARAVYGMQGNSVTGNGTGNAIAADSSGTGEQICFVNVVTSNTSLDNFFMAGNFQVPLLTAQTIYWKASTTSASNRIDVTGWEY